MLPRFSILTFEQYSPKKARYLRNAINIADNLAILSLPQSTLYQISERKNFRNATVVNMTAKKQSSITSTAD